MNHDAQEFTGLSKAVSQHLESYIGALEGHLPTPGLYKRVLCEIEKPLIVSVLKATNGSQAQAARVLGLSRNTLRKKIEDLRLNTDVEKMAK